MSAADSFQGGIPQVSSQAMQSLNKYTRVMGQLQKTTAQMEQFSGFARISEEMKAAGSGGSRLGKELIRLQMLAGAAAGTVKKRMPKLKSAAENQIMDLRLAAKEKLQNASKAVSAGKALVTKPFKPVIEKIQARKAAAAQKRADEEFKALLETSEHAGVKAPEPPKVKGIKKLRGKMDSLSSEDKKSLSGFASSIGGQLGKLKDKSLEAALQYSEAMDVLRASSKAGPGEMRGLEGLMKSLGGQVPQKISEVAKVVGTLSGKAKLSGNSLKLMARTVLDASRLSGMASGDAASAAADVLSSWGSKAGDGVDMMNKFFAASRASGVGMDDLLKNMGSLGVPMEQMGLDFGQSMALMAKWQSDGLTPLQDAMKKDVKNEGFAKIAAKIREASNETEAAAVATQYFGDRVAGDMVTALRGGQVEFGGVIAAMSGAKNAIADQSAQVVTFGDKWSTLQNRITIALAPLGEALLPLGEALASIVEVLTKDGDIVLATLGAISAVLLGVFAPAGWAAVAPFLPLIGIILLVGAAVAGLAYLFKYHMDSIMKVVNIVKDGFVSLLEKFGLFGGATAKLEVSGTAAGSVTANGGPPTSKYHGMDYVPYDGMMARLHKGERIMTASENRDYTSGRASGPISITGNTFHVRQESDIDAIARALAREIKAAGGLMA